MRVYVKIPAATGLRRIGRRRYLGGEPHAAVFPNWDTVKGHFLTSLSDRKMIIASRYQRNDSHKAHILAVGLLEVHIAANKAAESRNEVAVDLSHFKSSIRPNINLHHDQRDSW